jgi:putative ABC transport system permease protein
MFLVIRTDSDPSTVIGGVRNQLSAMDPNLPLADVATMRERLGESVGEQRFRTLLMGSFSAFALLLACFGIYAVMSYSVAQRTREIGIRMALGARRREVFKMVLVQAAGMCAAGLGAGLIAALLLTRALRSLLFGIGPDDPMSFAGTIALLLVVALLASYIPARRATKVDAMIALRYE